MLSSDDLFNINDVIGWPPTHVKILKSGWNVKLFGNLSSPRYFAKLRMNYQFSKSFVSPFVNISVTSFARSFISFK